MYTYNVAGCALGRAITFDKISLRQSGQTNPGKQINHQYVNMVLRLASSVMYI